VERAPTPVHHINKKFVILSEAKDLMFPALSFEQSIVILSEAEGMDHQSIKRPLI